MKAGLICERKGRQNAVSWRITENGRIRFTSAQRMSERRISDLFNTFDCETKIVTAAAQAESGDAVIELTGQYGDEPTVILLEVFTKETGQPAVCVEQCRTVSRQV